MNAAGKTITDEELARQSRAGSAEAFEELVCRYEHRVYAFTAQYFQNRLDAREVAQDTFVKAFQAIAQFDSCRAFAPWLFTIARRKCIDRLRATQRTRAEPLPEMIDFNTPAETLAANEERAALWSLARRHLPQLQYEALWLRYAEDMDVAQIAQVLRKTRIHIKVLLFRARQTLSLQFKSPGGAAADQRRQSLEAQPTREGVGPLPTTGNLMPLPGRHESI